MKLNTEKSTTNPGLPRQCGAILGVSVVGLSGGKRGLVSSHASTDTGSAVGYGTWCLVSNHASTDAGSVVGLPGSQSYPHRPCVGG
ncbi:MAG: hypothetical protein U9N73_06835 [Candidatus Auribacterota bacterium]|nr:hypothetical protein [Candidatus Auribacterota bacterium]